MMSLISYEDSPERLYSINLILIVLSVFDLICELHVCFIRTLLFNVIVV